MQQNWISKFPNFTSYKNVIPTASQPLQRPQIVSVQRLVLATSPRAAKGGGGGGLGSVLHHLAPPLRLLLLLQLHALALQRRQLAICAR